MIIWQLSALDLVARNICGTAPQFCGLQHDYERYRAWLDNLPASLEGSRLAEKLQAIAELDLEELQAIEIPRGYAATDRGGSPPIHPAPWPNC